MKYLLLITLLITSLCSNVTLLDENKILLQQNTYRLNGNVDIESALKSKDFIKNNNLPVLIRSKFKKNFWLKIPLKNKLNKSLEKTLLFYWKNVTLDIYYKNKNGIVDSKTINDRLSNGISFYSFTIAPQEESEIYIKVLEHELLDDFSSVYIVNTDRLIWEISYYESFYKDSFFLGILLTMLFSSLIMYFTTSLKSYLYYVLFLFSIIFVTSNFQWVLFPLLKNIDKELAFLIMKNANPLSVLITLTLFSQEFFDLKRKYPKINKFFNFFMILVVLMVIIEFLFSHETMIPFYPGLLLPCFVILGLIMLKEEKIQASLYTIAMIFLIYPLFMETFIRTFEVEGFQNMKSYLQVTSTICSVCLSFATYVKLRSIIEEKRKFEQQVLIKSRFTAMGEMIANIAHQWRQPLSHLSSIVVNIDMHNSLNKLSPELLKEKTNEMTLQLKHMSNTIEDFMNFFSRKKQKTTFTFKELIEDAKTFMHTSFEANNIKVALDSKDNYELHTYKNELLQVILTVLTNAKDALKDIPENDRLIYIEAIKNEITITDNAGGIDEKIIEHIFEPYFTTKGEKNGTGLGLYTAKIIMEKNIMGSINVINTKDGAKFIIKLPND